MKSVPQFSTFVETLRLFERTGRYADGLKHLSDIWPDICKPPDITGLSEVEAADLLVRCGVLAGQFGRFRYGSDIQENAKNLITRAHDTFIRLGDEVRIADAENALCSAYLRIGELREAEAWAESALSRHVPELSYVRLETFVCRSQILVDRQQYQETLDFLEGVAPLFEEFDDDLLNGSFAVNLGIAKSNLGDFAGAMQSYSLGRHFHKAAGHVIYLATVENNMAYLYAYEGRYDLAHHCIRIARESLNEVGDISRLGYSYDTEADLLLMEGKHDEALAAIDIGIGILKQTEFADFLIESFVTKMKILVAKDEIASAAVAFNEAASCAAHFQGDEKVAKLAKTFEECLRHSGYGGLGKIYSERIIPGEELELELPPSLAHYKNFDAVWIKNGDLESVGLAKGSLALVVDGAVERGEIAALVERGFEEVICGFFDSDFGIVSISNGRYADLQVFSEESVEVLGKIIGFADPKERHEGKLIVRPLILDN